MIPAMRSIPVGSMLFDLPANTKSSELLCLNLAFAANLEREGRGDLAVKWLEDLAAWLARPQPEIDGGKAVLPDHERGRTQDELTRLAYLESRIGNKALKKEKREAAADERDRLIAAPGIKAEQAWRDTAAAETTALAEARGEAVERQPSGVVEIRSRDPLMSLLRTGKLTAAQYDAAVICRDCYDARSADVGSQMGALGSGAPHNNDAFVHRRLQHAKKLQRIGVIERAVALDCRHEPVALTMLRVICGQNLPMSSQGKGRTLDRNAAAFAMALDVADGIIRGQG